MVDVNEVIEIPCEGCGKNVRTPAWRVNVDRNSGRRFVTFCSRRCNVRHVAFEGMRQQESARNARLAMEEEMENA